MDNQIKDWLKVNTNIAYSDYSGTHNFRYRANRAGVVLSVINTPTYAPIWILKSGQYYNNFYGANLTHPIENLSRTEDNRYYNNRILGSFSAEVDILPSYIQKQ